MPNPVPPPLNPATGQPVTPDMFEAIFPMNIIEQEVSTERWINIPEEVLEKYLIWRPMNEGLPCRNVLGCWKERMDIIAFLREKFTDEELKKAFACPPKSRIERIIESMKRE
jgi:hypothetical protein